MVLKNGSAFGLISNLRWAMGCAVTRDGQWGALSIEMGNGVRCH